MKVKEQDIKKQILDYLRYRGIFCWVNNVGALKKTYKNKTYYVTYGIKGQADITGILPDGRRLEIEVKTPEELEKIKKNKIPNSKLKHINDQKKFLKLINMNNGIAFFASSVEEVIKKLKFYD